MNKVVQSELIRKEGDKTIRYVTWIPSKYKRGSQVNIDGIVWTVEQSYSILSEKDAVNNSTDHKKHRKATDI